MAHDIHHFYVVKGTRNRNRSSKYFTGAFDMKRPWWKFWQKKKKKPTPVLSASLNDAQIFFSPMDAQETVTEQRMEYPEYSWYTDVVILTEYENLMMQPRFFMAVRQKGRKHFHYFYREAEGRLVYTDSIDYALLMDFDEARRFSEEFPIKFKGWEWAIAKVPDSRLAANALTEYLKTAPRAFCMTFKLPKK